MVNDEDLDWTCLLFQFETKLFLQGCKERGAEGVRRWGEFSAFDVVSRPSGLASVWCPFQLEIIESRKPSPFEYGEADFARQDFGEIRYWHALAGQVAPSFMEVTVAIPGFALHLFEFRPVPIEDQRVHRHLSGLPVDLDLEPVGQ